MITIGSHMLIASTFLLATAVQSQTVAIPQTAISLATFEGQYAYHDDGTLFLVAHDGQLYAVIGDGKYLLRRAGTYAFTNGGGDTIPFALDAAGLVTAFREGGKTFARLKTTVPVTLRHLFEPRPVGPDGQRAVYAYVAPPEMGDDIPVSAASAATFPRDAAERIVNSVIDGSSNDVHAILIMRSGSLVLEEYFHGYDRERPHQMRSLTKTVLSLAVGAAADRGLLAPDAPALARLGLAPFANPDPRKERITSLDLLSHRSGLACDDRSPASPGGESTFYEHADWMRTFVDLPMAAEPGTVAHYCSAGMLAAGRVVERASGKSLRAFADEAIFRPLGVEPGAWMWQFALDRSGMSDFGQIHLRPRDMLKLGMLVEQRGAWRGKQVISASWIDAATARVSSVDDSDYGLGIWHRYYNVRTATGTRRVDTIMFSGNGGQKVYLVPSLDLIVVFTGGAYNAESPVNRLMASEILPALLP